MSHLVANPEDRFSRDMSQLSSVLCFLCRSVSMVFFVSLFSLLACLLFVVVSRYMYCLCLK